MLFSGLGPLSRPFANDGLVVAGAVGPVFDGGDFGAGQQGNDLEPHAAIDKRSDDHSGLGSVFRR